jgi:hypothetical protein
MHDLKFFQETEPVWPILKGKRLSRRHKLRTVAFYDAGKHNMTYLEVFTRAWLRTPPVWNVTLIYW